MGYFIHEDQPAGLPLANLDELNDTNITTPADGDVLAYDSTSGKWLNSKIDKGSVSVTSDGVKTISTLMNTLYALIDKTKISKDSVLVEDDQNGDRRYYYCGHYDSSSIIMSGTINVDTTPRLVYDGYGLRSTGSAYVRTILSNTVTSGNYSTQTPSSGRVYTFYY